MHLVDPVAKARIVQCIGDIVQSIESINQSTGSIFQSADSDDCCCEGLKRIRPMNVHRPPPNEGHTEGARSCLHEPHWGQSWVFVA